MLTAPKPTGPSRPALNETDRLIQGVFEPPTSFIAAAIARYKWVVCAVAVVLAAAGTVYGRSLSRTYTASATLQVGQVNPNSPGFYGYVQSAAALATTFSRAIDAEPVLAAASQKMALRPTQVASRLSAEPIPTSPAFRVIATGPSSQEAIGLANVAATALISYEGQSNSTNPQAASLLNEYREASLDLRRATAKVARQSRGRRGYSNALAAAEAAQNAASVKLRALGVAYTSAIASRAPSSGLVSLVAGASGASNDGGAKTQKFGFIGLLFGVVLGCLVAIGFERTRLARGRKGVDVELPQQA